jgi:LysR family hydrogen peroxide-inducible transcriptional activator
VKKDLEFQALEHFVVVARMKNFTRAAAELHLSQSALTRSIQRLEELFGQPLFERKPREVALTDLGALLLERATEILKLVEDTFSELSEAGRRGRIRLGAIPTIAPYFLPGLLGDFAGRFPDISVVVQEDTTESLIRRCSHGEIDLAILALPVEAKYLEVEPLFSEELLLVVPAGHPLEKLPVITADVVDRYPFVILNEAHCLSENIASFCRQQSIHPVTIERTSQLATIQELVALDHGVSMVPEMARRIDLSDRRVYRSFSGEKPRRTVAMMWNSYRYQSQSVKALMECLRNQSRSMQQKAGVGQK